MADIDYYYNSSDDDLGPSPDDPFASLGAQSIEDMLENAFEDRRKSKEHSKHLAQATGTPKMRMNRALIWNRFKAFYTTTLQKQLTTTPTGQDIERFFTTMTQYMKPVADSVPRYQTVKTYLIHLITKFIFEYPDFKLTAHERSRIASTFKTMLDAGKLTKSSAREAQWVGIVLVKKIVIAIIEDAINQGTLSWDVTISRILSIVLLGSLGARTGDISKAQGYQGLEFARWEHVDIRIRSGKQPVLDNLVVQFTIAYEKGHKDDPKLNRPVKHYSLTNPEDNAVCPIKWLLIHALRNGCVKAASIDEVLQSANQRMDKAIVWTHPHWPILPAFSKSSSFVDFQKPAPANQIWSTVRLGGLLAGLLALICPHDIRRGSFQDMANLAMAPGFGTAMDRVAETMGHSNKSYTSGVTKKYVGAISDPTLLEKRLRTEVNDTFSLKSASGSYKKLKVSDEEVKKYCGSHDLDSSNKTHRKTARRRLDAHNLQQWLENEKSRGAVHEKNSFIASDRSATALAERTDSQINAEHGFSVPSAEIMEMNTTDSSHYQAAESFQYPDPLNDGAIIDPRLLSQELSIGEQDKILSTVQQDLASAVEGFISGSIDIDINENIYAAVFPLSDDLPKSDSPWLLDGMEFIDYFSTINIVRNAKLALWGPANWEREAPKHVATGNSRNAPSHYKWKCINHVRGCRYVSNTPQDLKKHEDICKITSEAAAAAAYLVKAFPCTHENCESSFDTARGRDKHVKDYHLYVPKSCDKVGCDPTIVYDTIGKWKNHQDAAHSGFPPTRCSFVGCTSKTVFNRLPNLTQHLRQSHGLKTVEGRLPYVPKWTPRRCNLPGCEKNTYVFTTIKGLTDHYKKCHDRIVDVEGEPHLAWDS